jgi:hypothetical protein
MAPMGYSGAWRKQINEKNLKPNSHVRLPLNMNEIFIKNFSLTLKVDGNEKFGGLRFLQLLGIRGGRSAYEFR